jgi:hypothetical protein
MIENSRLYELPYKLLSIPIELAGRLCYNDRDVAGGMHSVGAYFAVSLTPFHFGGEFALEC